MKTNPRNGKVGERRQAESNCGWELRLRKIAVGDHFARKFARNHGEHRHSAFDRELRPRRIAVRDQRVYKIEMVVGKCGDNRHAASNFGQKLRPRKIAVAEQWVR